MKKYLGTVGILLMLGCTSIVIADVFQEIDKNMEELEKILLEQPEECSNSSRIQGFWYEYTTTSIPLFNEQIAYKEGSATFREQLKQYDEKIHDLLKRLDGSLAACSRESTVKSYLKNIADLRNGEIIAVSNGTSKTKKFLSEKDIGNDGRAELFSQTKKLWEQVQQDFAELKKAMNEMKNGDNTAWKIWKVDKSDRAAITKRAENRAQAYVEDFASEFRSGLYTPLQEEHSRILSNLRKLPEGDNSTTSFDFIKNSGLGILSEEAKKNVKAEEEKLSDIQVRQNAITQFQMVEQNKNTEQELQRLSEGIKKRIEDENAYSQYDEALTQEILNSLGPFHSTLLETSVLLDSQARALEKMADNQNTAVD